MNVTLRIAVLRTLLLLITFNSPAYSAELFSDAVQASNQDHPQPGGELGFDESLYHFQSSAKQNSPTA